MYGGPSVLNDLCYFFQASAATVVVKAGKERDQRAWSTEQVHSLYIARDFSNLQHHESVVRPDFKLCDTIKSVRPMCLAGRRERKVSWTGWKMDVKQRALCVEGAECEGSGVPSSPSSSVSSLTPPPARGVGPHIPLLPPPPPTTTATTTHPYPCSPPLPFHSNSSHLLALPNILMK